MTRNESGLPDDLRRASSEIAETGQRVHRLGLAVGRGGSISVRTDEGIVITPTGHALGLLAGASLSVLDAQGRVQSGPKASKETPMHLAIHESWPDADAIVHLHSDYATAVASMDPWSDYSALPPLTPYFLMTVGRVPLVDFAPPGSDRLAESVRKLGHVRAALMANHGQVTASATLEGAAERAIQLEATARVHLLSRGDSQKWLSSKDIRDLAKMYEVIWDPDSEIS